MPVVARLFCLHNLKEKLGLFSLHVHRNPRNKYYTTGVFCSLSHDCLVRKVDYTSYYLFLMLHMLLSVLKTIGKIWSLLFSYYSSIIHILNLAFSVIM